MREKSCCFTGHRELSMGEALSLRRTLPAEIERLYTERGVTEFYAGGALGFDTLAAKAVLKARERLPVHLHLLLPCRDQSRGWTARDKAVYDELVKRADSAKWLSERYARGCMHRRNNALVDASAYCLCFLKRETGGTAYTVARARRAGLCVRNLCAGAQLKMDDV